MREKGPLLAHTRRHAPPPEWSPPAMKPKITGKKGTSGSVRSPGAALGGGEVGEKRRRHDGSAAPDGDEAPPLTSAVASFQKQAGTFVKQAQQHHDWQGEKSVSEAIVVKGVETKTKVGKGVVEKKKVSSSSPPTTKPKSKSTEPVVNRKKPPRPTKKPKTDQRFGSEADKKKLADERFDERREAKRLKYVALTAASAEADGTAGDETEISGKILGRRRRAAEKRARLGEKRKAARTEKGLPCNMPVKVLPAKLLVGTAAGVSALLKTNGDGDGQKSGKNAKRKERREKASAAREAEDAKEGVTQGDKKADQKKNSTIAEQKKTVVEESAKAKSRREKREAAEALERRAAALRAAADSESDSESERDESESESAQDASVSGSGGHEKQKQGGDWGEDFSSDEDDVDSDEERALDDAFREDSDDDAMGDAVRDSDDESPSNSEDDVGDAPGGATAASESEDDEDDKMTEVPVRKELPKKQTLVDKMRAKLSGGQFRMLNEQLYTTTGDKALAMVKDQPGMFSSYHAGFREQTKEWPTRPVDVCLRWLKTQPKTLRVADFGCGDAELAKRAPQKNVHSFDLESDAPGVVACNMADVPLDNCSVEIAVFSLSLMGTDYGKFMEEAHRVRLRNLFLFLFTPGPGPVACR